MTIQRANTIAAINVGTRIASGYGVLLLLLVLLAAITIVSLSPVITDAERVKVESGLTETATAIALQVEQTRTRTLRYAQSANLADRNRAQESLDRLAQLLEHHPATSEKTPANDETEVEAERDSLASHADRYRIVVAETIADVSKRRARVEALQSSATRLRTLSTATAGAMELEADPDLIRAGIGLALAFSAADATSARYVASGPAGGCQSGARLDRGFRRCGAHARTIGGRTHQKIYRRNGSTPEKFRRRARWPYRL